MGYIDPTRILPQALSTRSLVQLMFGFFKTVVYVQLSPNLLTLRNPKTGESISERPEVAISAGPNERMVAVGSEARTVQASQTVHVVNPFAHPRSLVSDFTVAEQLLKAFLKRLVGQSMFAVAPEVVMHPQGDPVGGFTQIEIRALHEMALGAGARQVKIWQGRTLTDEELLSRQFPSDGRVLA